MSRSARSPIATTAQQTTQPPLAVPLDRLTVRRSLLPKEEVAASTAAASTAAVYAGVPGVEAMGQRRLRDPPR
jgi:hypothetical protein